MAENFFYCSVAAILFVLLICTLKKGIAFRHFIIATTAIGYSLLFETSLGEYSGLYYYVSPEDSLLYIIIATLSLYPAIEIIYVMFLPARLLPTLIYTFAWIVMMLVFELASIHAGTIVLTGWRILPWSVITYMVTFLWINLLYRYLRKRGL